MTALLFLIAALLLLLQGERQVPSQPIPQDGKGVVRVAVKQKDTAVLARPILMDAINEVGLKLEPGTAPMEIWTVAHAERPTGN